MARKVEDRLPGKACTEAAWDPGVAELGTVVILISEVISVSGCILLEVLRETCQEDFPWCILGARTHAALSAGIC